MENIPGALVAHRPRLAAQLMGVEVGPWRVPSIEI